MIEADVYCQFTVSTPMMIKLKRSNKSGTAMIKKKTFFFVHFRKSKLKSKYQNLQWQR